MSPGTIGGTHLQLRVESRALWWRLFLTEFVSDPVRYLRMECLSSFALKAWRFYHVFSYPNSNVKIKIWLFVGGKLPISHLLTSKLEFELQIFHAICKLPLLLRIQSNPLRCGLFTAKPILIWTWVYELLLLWLFIGSKLPISHLLIPKFEFELHRARTQSGDCVSSYTLDVRRYNHFCKFNVSLGTNSNLNLRINAHYLGNILVSMNERT